MHILHLKNFPILEQLQLEEALLRLSDENFCLINEGSPPAIVMGISGKPEELVHLENLEKEPIPLIKRYSGGGTVVVDEETIFVSFLCQKDLHDFAPYPEPIMRWSEGIYREVLIHPEFSLRENDYVFGERKFGGNAQYLRKDRWLHHTTFLWDYKKERMDLLLHPKKTPNYRSGRSHDEFITKLNAHFSSKAEFVDRLKEVLQVRYKAQEIGIENLLPLLNEPHRKSTQIIPVHHPAL
ncbi:MAG: lipoate--protein ligase family protein [Simkaniaceae bacterium]|nr:lipoate--protein ligase family protein [Candidatus Sacchlamyda saccharinae]